MQLRRPLRTGSHACGHRSLLRPHLKYPVKHRHFLLSCPSQCMFASCTVAGEYGFIVLGHCFSGLHTLDELYCTCEIAAHQSHPYHTRTPQHRRPAFQAQQRTDINQPRQQCGSDPKIRYADQTHHLRVSVKSRDSSVHETGSQMPETVEPDPVHRKLIPACLNPSKTCSRKGIAFVSCWQPLHAD